MRRASTTWRTCWLKSRWITPYISTTARWGEQLRDAQDAMSDAQEREYAEGLGALYGCKPEKVARARGAPRRFYGDMHDVDQLFVGGRTKIVLRKLGLPFSEENTEKTCRLIEEGARMTGDYMDFIDESVDALSDWEAWTGESAIEGEAV